MPLPEGVIPDPDRPFITVRTATRFHDPDEIRGYATREECLTDLHGWQDTSLVRQDPYYHLGVGYQGDDDTYTFEVYENGELRLQVDVDRLGQRQAGPWARPTEVLAPQLDDHIARHARDEEHDAVSWAIAQDRSTPAGQLLSYLSDPDEVPEAVKSAIFRTFETMCDEVSTRPGAIDSSQYERLLKRAAERHLQTMTDTPLDTWENIKADYAALFEAAGNDINALPYQEGFPALRDLVRSAVDAAHYPDRQENKLQALLDTLNTQHQRFFEVTNLTRALHGACLQLNRLEQEASNLYHQPFRRTEPYFEWLPKRDEIFARLHRLRADPVLKHHLPFLDIEHDLDRIADPSLSTAFDPVLADQRRRFDFSPEMETVAAIYSRAHADMHDADLIPYSAAHFSDLETAVETAIGAAADNPRQLGALYTLQAQLSISTGRRETAHAAIDDLTEVSTQLTSLQAWASSNRQPIHRAPQFAAWRDRADEVHDRCQRMRTDYHLSVHFQRTGVSNDSVAMTLALLRDSRFQKPPSPEQIAAQRQARAEARADSREESASMSA